jgi:hypothetical protein
MKARIRVDPWIESAGWFMVRTVGHTGLSDLVDIREGFDDSLFIEVG